MLRMSNHMDYIKLINSCTWRNQGSKIAIFTYFDSHNKLSVFLCKKATLQGSQRKLTNMYQKQFQLRKELQVSVSLDHQK